MKYWKKGFNDERKNKENNSILAQGFDIFTLFILVCGIFKYVKMTHATHDFYVEIVTLLIGGGFVIYKLLGNQLLGKRNLDQYAQEVKDSYKAIGFAIYLISILIGEFLYYYISKNMGVSGLYLLVWIIPTLCCSWKMMRKSTLVTGTENNKKITLKILKRRTAIGSVFFGICLCGNDVYYDNSFHVSGILWMIYAMLAFGFIFYLLFKQILMVNDKKESKQ